MKNDPAMLFAGALYAVEDNYLRAKNRLTETFGPILLETGSIAWGHSDYYVPELGSPIMRRFIFFEKPVAQERLKEVKLKTVDVEKELSAGGKRTVNIDPGYLTLAKVVLASTKDYAHRIYLGDGIFAEVALYYRKGARAFEPHTNTYRDYKDSAGIFTAARESLSAMLRRGEKEGPMWGAKTSP